MKLYFAGGHHMPLLPGAGPQGVPLPQDAARDAGCTPGKCSNNKTYKTIVVTVERHSFSDHP